MVAEKTIRIFVSSPGDVAEERDLARCVVEELRRRYAGRLKLRAVLWEDLPLTADMSMQQGIDLVLSERGVDIALFILWSRLGSPVGALIRRDDGFEYRSGTEREWDLMWKARARGDRPRILVYARRDDPSFAERLRGRTTDEQGRLVQQKKLLEQFLVEEFTDVRTGTNVRARHSYDRPKTFAERLRVHLQELLDPLTGGALSDPVWDMQRLGPPFLGLDAFDFQHESIFFGREDEVVAVRQMLREQARRGCAFVLIAGASGSGKSSLARAGVLPTIVKHETDGEVHGWRRAVFTPGEGDEMDRRQMLVRALAAESALPALAATPGGLAQLAADFERDPDLVCRHVLHPALESKGRRERLIVLIDQLEEIFTDQRMTAEIRDKFFCAIEAMARSGFVWVIATVRSDFYAQCQSVPALMRLKEGAGQFDLTPPGVDALERLICGPAALAGLQYERRGDTSLTRLILQDATAHRELLPLVEYLLHRLCEERTPEGVMTFASYEALGGVEGALASRADRVIAELKPTEATLDTLLAALVTLSGDEQESFVRRRVPWAEVDGDPATRGVVAALIGERLLTSSAFPGGPALVTVAHEALFRVWGPAKEWTERNREFLRVRAHVAERLNQWKVSARQAGADGAPGHGDASFLLQAGRELNDAREHFERYRVRFSEEQRTFILKSLEAVEEKNWRSVLGAGDEEAMSAEWRRLEGEYASMRERVLHDVLAHGSKTERRHAALLVGMVESRSSAPPLIRRLLEDADAGVLRAVAYSLLRLDEVGIYDELAAHRGRDADDATLRSALAHLLVAADMQVHARNFDAWYRKLPRSLRQRVRLRSWQLRLRMAVPVFFAVVIPAVVLATLSTMAFKWIPGNFNYAFVQSRAGWLMALFHAATAAILMGGSSAFGITLYRMVFGREHARCNYLRPFQAIVAGALFGALGGLLIAVVVAGVYGHEQLVTVGWLWAHADPPRNFFELLDVVLLETRSGWVFVLNGVGVGTGMAMMTNRLRGLDRWKNLLEECAATTLGTLQQVGGILRRLIRVSLPCAWTLPAALTLTSMLSLAVLGEKPSGRPMELGGGRVSTSSGGKTGTDDAQAVERRQLREWKTSRFGRIACIGSDAATKALGAFFAVVGMGFGIVLLRSGIRVEPWRKMG